MATLPHASPLIQTKDLVKTYTLNEGQLVALDHVNLTFEKGEFAGLVGPSGSGKTTLLNILGSLDQPSGGSAEVLGEKIENLTHKQAADLRECHRRARRGRVRIERRPSGCQAGKGLADAHGQRFPSSMIR